MTNRLSIKLAVVVTVGIALVYSVYGWLRVERELAQFESDARRDHTAMTHALKVAAMSTDQRAGSDAARELLEDADLRTDHAHISWFPGQGPRRVESRISHDDGDFTLTSQVALTLGSTPGVLQIRERLVAEDAYVRDTIQRTVIVTLMLLVLCFVVLITTSYWLFQRPMEALVRKVERIGRGDLSGPLNLAQRDELGTLAGALDMMCDQLEELQRRNAAESQAKIAALQQLRHADRLSTVGKLASGIAHELGTPLNVVNARAKLIVRGHSKGDDAVDDARIIVEQSDRMTTIIRQLLDFARHRKPERTDEKLAKICEQVLRILEPLARKTGVSLELVPGADPTASVDAAQLEQVLTNLVMNAIHAQPEGGAVRVAAVDDANGIAITVEDDGDGMSDSVRERVFEPFFTTKDVGQGTGLGLSVAYGIVAEHGGRIDVESAGARGTRFTVHLPG